MSKLCEYDGCSNDAKWTVEIAGRSELGRLKNVKRRACNKHRDAYITLLNEFNAYDEQLIVASD